MIHGHGPVPCRAMLVGPYPGAVEMSTGVPWSGPAGKLLNRLLSFYGLPREEVFVTNLLRQPPEVDNEPSPEEIRRDMPALLAELRQVRPSYIALVGGDSLRWFTSSDLILSAAHGRPILDSMGLYTYLPSYNPAAGLRNPDDLGPVCWDIDQFAKLVRGEIHPPIRRPETGSYLRIREEDKGRIGDIFEEHRAVKKGSPEAKHDSAGLYCAVDTEYHPLTRRPWGLSFSARPGTGYVILAQDTQALQALRDALTVNNCTIVYHNYKADAQPLRDMGISLDHLPFVDTMLMAYNCRIEPQGLKALAWRHCDMEMEDYDDIVNPITNRKMLEWLKRANQIKWPMPKPVLDKGKFKQPQSVNKVIKRLIENHESIPNLRTEWRKQPSYKSDAVEVDLGPPPIGSVFDVELDRAIKYAGRDADATISILPPLQRLQEELGDVHVLAEIQLAALPMIEAMERNGIYRDKQHFVDLARKHTREMSILKYRIAKAVGRKTDPASPKQTAELLFGSNGLGFKSVKKTKTGQDSTQDKVLEGLSHLHPAVKMHTDYRELAKLKSSYDLPIAYKADPDDRLRCQLKHTSTVTMRLAPSDPINLTTMPTRTETGKEIRKGFIAPPGRRLATWDLDQIEMRIMAHESRDENLCRVFRTNTDVHREAGSWVFNVPRERVEPYQRQAGKTVNFLIINDGTSKGLWEQFLKNNIVTYEVRDCAEMLENWHKGFPGVREFFERCRAEARRDRYGRVRDWSGHARWCPGVRWLKGLNDKSQAEAERHTHSMKIQGGAQKLIQRAMGPIWKGIQKYFEPGQVMPLLQIHDELMFEIEDDDDVFWMLNQIVVKHLTQAVELRVPVLAKGNWAYTWGDLK